MKKLYDAPKALNLDNILSEEVFSDDVVTENVHECKCEDYTCSEFNKTFEKWRK